MSLSSDNDAIIPRDLDWRTSCIGKALMTIFRTANGVCMIPAVNSGDLPKNR